MILTRVVASKSAVMDLLLLVVAQILVWRQSAFINYHCMTLKQSMTHSTRDDVCHGHLMAPLLLAARIVYYHGGLAISIETLDFPMQ
mgnify:CR=1 FL=1